MHSDLRERLCTDKFPWVPSCNMVDKLLMTSKNNKCGQRQGDKDNREEKVIVRCLDYETHSQHLMAFLIHQDKTRWKNDSYFWLKLEVCRSVIISAALSVQIIFDCDPSRILGHRDPEYNRFHIHSTFTWGAAVWRVFNAGLGSSW